MSRQPLDAVIAITHRCNARCVMCNVWKNPRPDALEPGHLAKLPIGLKTINLSGGEPFLRDDLPEFVRQARRRCPHARITISTNALLPGKIAEMMDEILRIDPSVRLAVSLDGVGAAHDRVRGCEGAFDNAMELIDRMTRRGYRGLRLGMTVSRDNADQVLPVARLASEKRLELGIVAAHAARTHLGVDELPAPSDDAALRETFEELTASWLRSWRPRQWLRAHFAWNTYRFLIGRHRRFRCRAGREFFFLRADGTVFNCSVRGMAMGDITRQEWPEIWRGPAAGDARAQAGRCGMNCWMICTARSVYRAGAVSVMAWIAVRKLLAHVRSLFKSGTSVQQERTSETTKAPAPVPHYAGGTPAWHGRLPTCRRQAGPGHEPTGETPVLPLTGGTPVPRDQGEDEKVEDTAR